MQTIGKVSRRLPIPVFITAALVFGALAPNAALAQAEDNPSEQQLTAIKAVSPSVTGLSVLNFNTGNIQLTWGIGDEDSSIEEHRSGYCIRARPEEAYDWTESCADGTATTASVTVGKPYHCRSQGVDYDTQGQVKIKYWNKYSPWSDVYEVTVKWFCSLSCEHCTVR